jgi:hypothetical protein
MKNTIFRKLVISACALALSIVPALPALADDAPAEDQAPKISFRVTPVGERLSLDPGQVVDKKLSVTNQSQADSQVGLYAAPYTVQGRDYAANYSQDTPRTQISRWISFAAADDMTKQEEADQPTKFVYPIKAGETREFTYHITVPSDVANGGQYAIIFVESINTAQPSTTSSSVLTNYRIGIPILANVGGETRDGAEISDVKLPVFYIGGKTSLVTGSAVAKNTGNTDFPVNQQLEVKTLFGRTVFTDNTSNDVFPDSERDVNLEWKDTPLVGFFWATYTVTALDQTVTSTHLVIVMPIIAIIIMLLLLTATIIWLIITLRKRSELLAKREAKK